MTDRNLIINVNKPKGMTSQHVVTQIKHIFSAKKAGHAGTLDPIATGVVLVCINEATKITRFLTNADKEYTARMKLGERTDTLDSEGRIIEKAGEFSLKIDAIWAVLKQFKGTTKQTPPMYSAIKVSGTPLYKLARKGMEIERPQKEINIYELDMLGFTAPFLEIRVVCSKGTYIRALCDNIGTALGVGAHVVELKRTRIGDFLIQDSANLSELPDKEKSFYSIDAALKGLGEFVLSSDDFSKAANGVPITPCNISGFPAGSFLRLRNPEGKLFAIGRVTDRAIRIERMLHLC